MRTAIVIAVAIPMLMAQSSPDIHAVQRAAEQGDTKAQLQMAHAYEDGLGVQKNTTIAMEWLRKAADGGNADAENELGVAYRMGNGVPRDFKEAVRWYRRAARNGSANAMFNLGTVYFNGEGEAISDDLALVWFSLAERAGATGAAEAVLRTKDSMGATRIMEAQLKLAEMYEQGDEIGRNDQEAAKIYLTLSDQAAASMRLARMYETGRGVPRDVGQAFLLCERAAKRGHPQGLYCVAAAHHRGLGTPQNIKQAARFYDRAGLAGIPRSFYQLAALHASGELGKPDRHTALMYYLLAQHLGAEGAKSAADTLTAELSAKEVEKIRKKASAYLREKTVVTSPFRSR